MWKVNYVKEIVVGMVADVDAGKTTLTEALLYKSGAVRTLGRVDKGNAHLDTEKLEKKRGITIFSHQTQLKTPNLTVNLLDTPGHLDFVFQTESALAVLDYAIMVISATDKLSQHTKTLWQLLKHYEIPTFIFINKMDTQKADKQQVLANLQANLASACLDFTQPNLEEIALQDEAVLETFLENGTLPVEIISNLISKRKVFPVYFGSALKLTGITEFLTGLEELTQAKPSKPALALRVFKISHDEKNERLTWVRLYGGTLQPKDFLADEKLNQIRIYDGTKYQLTSSLKAGQVAALTGLTQTKPGQVIGLKSQSLTLKPVLTFGVDLNGSKLQEVLAALKTLEDEEPQLKVTWQPQLEELSIQVMGEMQLEVLKDLLHQRFLLDVNFDQGSILYQETITDTMEGVGHFEPLRHYAEAHIYLEPLKRGQGVVVVNDCDLEVLSKNYQSQVMTALKEKTHKGVLMGAPLTDVKLTLVGGKAHLKHTEGGDFREASSRAVRQGLMELRQKGACQLLEPWYQFRIEVPVALVGKVMTDITQLAGIIDPDKSSGNILVGKAPVQTMRSYPTTLRTLSHGEGQIELSVAGYYPCHNEDEVLVKSNYQPESDLQNTPQSVFCSHGAGHTINWQDVPQTMHCPYYRLKS